MSEPVRAEAWPTCYEVGLLQPGDLNAHTWNLTVELRGVDTWAVVMRGHSCLSSTGKWDLEPIPSDRTDEWIKAHRFTLEEALRLAKAAAPGVTVNGRSAAEIADLTAVADRTPDTGPISLRDRIAAAAAWWLHQYPVQSWRLGEQQAAQLKLLAAAHDHIPDRSAADLAVGIARCWGDCIADAVLAALPEHTPAGISPEELADWEALLTPLGVPLANERCGGELEIWRAAGLARPGSYAPGDLLARLHLTPYEPPDEDERRAIARGLTEAPGLLMRLVTAYRELSASAAVQISTRDEQIAKLETALRSAIAQRDDARAGRCVMTRECAACGLRTGDLPDEVDPETIFERAEDGEVYCQGCAS